ncbi:MAG: DUF58 domain-containing protein [Myxococcales bacterium]|nr:DUF58 domain-containing protein [Myxococcales bacterium]
MPAKPSPSVATALDWGNLGPLRLRARVVAEGVWAGAHRSARRGAGIEFGGHREYSPGDDLRWLDRRSLLRHERLLVRQFETETDRALRLVVDATASMGYRGERAPGAKLAWAAVVAAALARVAITTGDPVGLSFIGGGPATRPVPVSGGRESCERILAALERSTPEGDAVAEEAMVDRVVGSIARTARRGSIVVVLSDLLDLPQGSLEAVATLAGRGRVLVVVQVLDPDEVDFPFDGPVRLRGAEGTAVVETDAGARDGYLARLAELTGHWDRELVGRGARLLRARTDEPPTATLRAIVDAARHAGC